MLVVGSYIVRTSSVRITLERTGLKDWAGALLIVNAEQEPLVFPGISGL